MSKMPAELCHWNRPILLPLMPPRAAEALGAQNNPIISLFPSSLSAFGLLIPSSSSWADRLIIHVQSSVVHAGCCYSSVQPEDHCHFPGPQLTHHLMVHKPGLGPAIAYLLLSEMVLFPLGVALPDGCWEVFNAFSSCHPQIEHSLLSFRVYFFKDSSLSITHDAPTPLQSSASICCPAPWLQTLCRQSCSIPPTHGDGSNVPAAAYSCAQPAKLALTVTVSNQISLKILIAWLCDGKRKQ